MPVASYACHMERKVSLDKYKTKKILMLEDEFCIRLSDDDIDHIRSLQTECEVDHAVHDILVKKL